MASIHESPRGPHDRNLNWIREGNTGCVFSQIIAQRTENGRFKWGHHVVDKTIDEIEAGQSSLVEQTQRALGSPDFDLFSLLFPSVTSPQDLTRLVQYLGNTPPFFISQIDEGKITPEDPETYYGVHLRITMEDGREAWPMMLGSFEHFSPGRRAPVTELIFKNVPTKNNPTTPDIQIGLDDSRLGLSSTGFSSIFNRTTSLAPERRGDYNREMSRARIAVVVPKNAWNHGGK